MLDHRGSGEPAIGAAPGRRHVLAQLRHAFDVRLIDDRIAPGDVRTLRLRPRHRLVDHNRLGHAPGIVTPIEGEIVTAAAGAIAEMHIAPGDPAGEPLGVRVDQQLVVIEAVSLLRRIGAMDTIAIKLARQDIVAIDMPDILAAFRQNDALKLAPALIVEQAKLDLGGMAGEQSKVDAFAVPCRPERMRDAPRDAHLSLRNEEHGRQRWHEQIELGTCGVL